MLFYVMARTGAAGLGLESGPAGLSLLGTHVAEQQSQ
jgi:hypothetical protein